MQYKTICLNRAKISPSGFMRVQRYPWLLWRSLVQNIFVWTIGATLFLALIISLAELFSLLWKFLAQDASFLSIMQWIGLGLPSHMLEALPVAFLFSVVFLLSDWYTNHELEAIWSAGLSLQRLLLPIIGLSILFSFAEFYGKDSVSIPLLRSRSKLQSYLLSESSDSQTPPGLIIEQGRFVYTYRFFDETVIKEF